MAEALSPAPFPWAALDRVPREAAGRLRDARRAVARAVDVAALSRALSEVARSPAEIVVSAVDVVAGEGEPLHGAAIVLGTADGRVRVGLEVDRDLARLLVGAALERRPALADPTRPLDPAVEGALAAVLAKVGRLAHATEALRPLGRGALRLDPGERAIRIEATALVGDEAYAVRATAPAAGLATPPVARSAREALSSLGAMPVSMPVVAAVAACSRDELASLGRGDAWMPGAGWTVARGAGVLSGDVLLVAPSRASGVRATLGPEGEIVVRGAAQVPLEVETMNAAAGSDGSTTIAEAAFDAPVVVRVELGSVTLSAREWAELSPGDVVAVGRRVSEPAILRVGGVEVARGELVDIEGELGVRIRERGDQ